VTALTGVNIYAGAFLIPVGVMLYTAHGGLKATFIAAWGECLPDLQDMQMLWHAMLRCFVLA
jgi:hypothetical protein